MGWDDIDDKIKKKSDSEFVSCEEQHELDYIKDIVRENYPNLDGAAIEEAIKKCCAEIEAPRPRTYFVKCLIENLDA